MTCNTSSLIDHAGGTIAGLVLCMPWHCEARHRLLQVQIFSLLVSVLSLQVFVFLEDLQRISASHRPVASQVPAKTVTCNGTSTTCNTSGLTDNISGTTCDISNTNNAGGMTSDTG